MKIGTATIDNSMEAPSKTNHRSGFVFVSFIPDLELKKANSPDMPMGTDKINNKRLLSQPKDGKGAS